MVINTQGSPWLVDCSKQLEQESLLGTMDSICRQGCFLRRQLLMLLLCTLPVVLEVLPQRRRDSRAPCPGAKGCWQQCPMGTADAVCWGCAAHAAALPLPPAPSAQRTCQCLFLLSHMAQARSDNVYIAGTNQSMCSKLWQS